MMRNGWLKEEEDHFILCNEPNNSRDSICGILFNVIWQGMDGYREEGGHFYYMTNIIIAKCMFI